MHEACEACDGSGKMHGDTCRYCGGIGWFEEEEPTQEDTHTPVDDEVGE